MTHTASLPVVRSTPGPTDEPRFAQLRAREQDLRRAVDRLSLADLHRFRLLSGNAKTSISLDFPIGHTCTPTALCAAVCYASRPGTPAAWDKSLVMRLRNLRYFALATPQAAADRLYKEFSAQRQAWTHRGVTLDYLRVNGTGDLSAPVVDALNLFAAQHSEVTLWIVSRRIEHAARIVALPNVYLQLSTDRTTTPEAYRASADLVRSNPRAYLSFLRTRLDDQTAAAIVFNEKRTEGLPYDGIQDCPVDAGRLELDNVRGKGGTACSKCRKCFSPRVLERQRLNLAGAT